MSGIEFRNTFHEIQSPGLPPAPRSAQPPSSTYDIVAPWAGPTHSVQFYEEDAFLSLAAAR